MKIKNGNLAPYHNFFPHKISRRFFKKSTRCMYAVGPGFRCWPNIKPTLGRLLVFARVSGHATSCQRQTSSPV